MGNKNKELDIIEEQELNELSNQFDFNVQTIKKLKNIFEVFNKFRKYQNH